MGWADGYIDGFEDYAAADAVDYGWAAAHTAVSTTQGRHGGRGAQVPQDQQRAVAAFTEGAIGGACRIHATDLGAMFAFYEGATLHLNLHDNGDGSLSIRRGTTVLATTATTVIASNLVHYFIEMVGKVHDSTGYYELWVDGVQLLAATGVDTRNAGAAGTPNTISVSGSKSYYLDDFYFLPGAAPARPGDVRVLSLYPNGNGNVSDWDGSDGNQTDNYLLVDDAQPNDDTDYLSTATAGERDLFTYENLPAGVTSVKAIAVCFEARKDDGGTREIAPVIRRSSTNYDGTTRTITSGYTGFIQLYDQDPSTAATWTVAGVDAAEFGVKCVT